MKKKILSKLAIVIALVVMLTSLPICVQEVSAAPRIKITYRVVYRIKQKAPKLSKKKVKIYKGDCDWIKLKNAKAKNVKWYSSNKKIAKVKRDGSWCKIIAKKAGKVNIKCKYMGRTYTCKVTVKPKKKKAFECWFNKPGDTITLDKELDSDGGTSLTFHSSLNNISLYYDIDDPWVAECDWEPWDEYDCADLTIYPKNEGSTWVTITNSYNKQKMRFKIVVKDDYSWEY